MYGDEFEEMLAADEADTLAYKALWRKRRPIGSRMRSTAAAVPTHTPPAAAPAYTPPAAPVYTPPDGWSAGRAKAGMRVAKRQVGNTTRKIDTLIKKRARENRKVLKLEEALHRHEANIADAGSKREEYNKQLAEIVKELDAFA